MSPTQCLAPPPTSESRRAPYADHTPGQSFPSDAPIPPPLETRTLLGPIVCWFNCDPTPLGSNPHVTARPLVAAPLTIAFPLPPLPDPCNGLTSLPLFPSPSPVAPALGT